MDSTLKAINPDAAGIDIGSEFHYVCVPDGRDEQTVKKFGIFGGPDLGSYSSKVSRFIFEFAHSSIN